MLAATAALAMVVAGLSTAEAARQPSPPEAKAIKRAALRACSGHGPPGSSCEFNGARVSTRDPHFAWANVTTDGFSATLLHRPTKRSTHFHVVAIQGGGIEPAQSGASRRRSASWRTSRWWDCAQTAAPAGSVGSVAGPSPQAHGSATGPSPIPGIVTQMSGTPRFRACCATRTTALQHFLSL
jgi:hypothetical protein